MNRTRIFVWIAIAAATVAVAAYVQNSAPAPDAAPTSELTIDLITGGPDAFWKIVAAGAEDAAGEYGVKLNLHEPDGTGVNQTEVLTAIKAENTDGVAISPLVPADQARLISLLAAKTKVVTFDNDAPRSTRICYIGTNNWTAGQLAADLIREALPDGGKIAIFIGDHERDNARHRRQAMLAALEGLRPNIGPEYPDLASPVTINNFEVAGTYLDGNSEEKAEENVKKALEDHDDLNAVVALYGYNGPACLRALKAAGKLGEIKIIAFDEHDATLQGIAEGHVFGTVVQQPYSYGFESVRLLADFNRRPDSSSPYGGSGTVYLPCEIVTQDNLEEFKAELAGRLRAK